MNFRNIIFLLSSLLPFNAFSGAPDEAVIAVYKANIPEVCKMLEFENQLTNELQQVSTIMDLDKFMALNVHDTTVPANIKASLEKVTSLQDNIVSIANKITPAELSEKQMSNSETIKVNAALNEIAVKDCGFEVVDPWTKTAPATATKPNNPPKKFLIAEEQAKAGDKLSKFIVGSMLVRGEEVTKNCELGIQWLKEAAAEKVPESYIALSAIYKKGLCGEKDNAQADHYSQLAKTPAK